MLAGLRLLTATSLMCAFLLFLCTFLSFLDFTHFSCLLFIFYPSKVDAEHLHFHSPCTTTIKGYSTHLEISVLL